MRRPSAVTRSSALRRERAEGLEVGDGLEDQAAVGLVEETELQRRDAPLEHAQHHAFQVEAADLGIGEVQAVLDAPLGAEEVVPLLDPAGAARALAALRGGDLGGIKALDAADDAHLLLDAAVDDGVDVVDGQAGLGDVGGHHRLGQGIVPEDLRLLGDGELRMQGQDDRLLAVVLQQLLQVLDGVVDLLLAGLEDQDVVSLLQQGCGVGQQEAGMTPLGLHREAAAGDGDDRGMVQERRDLLRLERGAHDQGALAAAPEETVVEVFLDLADQDLLVQVPLMDLVEDQHVVLAMALDLAHHLHSVGQVEQRGRGRFVAVQPGLVGDLPPPGQSAAAGKVVGERAGGDAPRLGDVHFFSGLPEPPGDAGRLAGPGLGGQDQHRVSGDGALDLAPVVVDGQAVLKVHE
jgi:hypothetical protein